MRRNGKNSYLCRYEKFVSNPDAVQRELTALHVSYQPKALFSEWNDKVRSGNPLSERQIEISRAIGSPRPIATNRIARWQRPEFRKRVESQFESFPKLSEWQKKFGYDGYYLLSILAIWKPIFVLPS